MYDLLPTAGDFLVKILFFLTASSSSELSESASESEVPDSAPFFFTAAFTGGFAGVASSPEDESLELLSAVFGATVCDFCTLVFPVAVEAGFWGRDLPACCFAEGLSSSDSEDESLLDVSFFCFGTGWAGFLAGGLAVSLSELLSLELDSCIRFKASLVIFPCVFVAGVTFCFGLSSSLSTETKGN